MRRMNLRPSALAASLAEIEGERQEIMARATRGRTGAENRARQLLSRLPEIVSAYRRQVENAVKVLARVEVVEDAREATRRLLVEGRIILAPNLDRTAVAGPVHFKTLGAHVLETAGWTRKVGEGHKLNGSGGPLRQFSHGRPHLDVALQQPAKCGSSAFARACSGGPSRSA